MRSGKHDGLAGQRIARGSSKCNKAKLMLALTFPASLKRPACIASTHIGPVLRLEHELSSVNDHEFALKAFPCRLKAETLLIYFIHGLLDLEKNFP